MGVLMGAALLVAGLLPVLYCAALVTWQFNTLFDAGSWVPLPITLVFSDHSLLQTGKVAPVLPLIPQIPWPWLASPETLAPVHKLATSLLGRVHVGLVFALAGLAVMAFGALRVRQCMSVIRAARERRADRLRRVQDYRLDDSPANIVDERPEPYLGSGSSARRVA